jgi:ubiquinone biosynthesis protein
VPASDATGTVARPRANHHLRRYRQVVRVLARHGFGFLLGGRRLPHLRPERNGAGPEAAVSRPQHLRLAFEELGVTFVKLGQVLSTRGDLLPPAYREELAKLQDHAPPVPAEAVQAILTAELGRPVEELFASFTMEPLATGSIGQAHAATLSTGEAVVVKVRRPGAVEEVTEDLDVLEALATTITRHWSLAARYDVAGVVRAFADTLRAEMDYLREASNAERFAANFAGEAGIHVPRVVRELTTQRVLTLERIDGIKIDDVAALDAAGIERPALAERFAVLNLKMVLDDGFFHADPHPGNFFVASNGRLGVIDFGMVGFLSAETREALIDLTYAVGSDDGERLTDSLLALGVAGHVDRARLRRDVEELIGRYRNRPLGDLPLGTILSDTLALVRRHGLRLPPNLALLTKTMLMVEGLGARLDPSFRLTPLLEPFATRLLLQRYAPRVLLRRLGHASIETLRLAEQLPPLVRHLLEALDRGDVEVGVRQDSIEPVLRRLELLANRLVMALLASSLIVGLAVLITVYHPPGWQRWADAAFAVGLLSVVAVGGYLAWLILRSRGG